MKIKNLIIASLFFAIGVVCGYVLKDYADHSKGQDRDVATHGSMMQK
jgi:hypothetical protein